MDRRSLFRRLVGGPGMSGIIVWIVGVMGIAVFVAYLVRDTDIRCPSSSTDDCSAYQTGGSASSLLVIAAGLAVVVAVPTVIRLVHRRAPTCPLCDTANPPGAKFCENCGTKLFT